MVILQPHVVKPRGARAHIVMWNATHVAARMVNITRFAWNIQDKVFQRTLGKDHG